MIKFRIENEKIIIYGQNKMAYAWIYLAVLLISIMVCVFMPFLLGLKPALLFGLIATLFLVVLRHLISFSIIVTSDTFTLKKSFLGIPYLTIKQHFDTVLYSEKVPIFYFQDQHAKIEVENFEGFEVDCLLVKTLDKEYEIGDKDDAALIIKFIMEGLDKLKVPKIMADIGYVGRT